MKSMRSKGKRNTSRTTQEGVKREDHFVMNHEMLKELVEGVIEDLDLYLESVKEGFRWQREHPGELPPDPQWPVTVNKE